MSDKPSYDKQHNDADYIDEVRVLVRERYKTSGLSGDEWRFAKVIQFYRKGRLVGERSVGGSMADALSYAPWLMVEGLESGRWPHVEDGHLCFQPGCPNRAIAEYEIIEEFGPQGHRLHPEEQAFSTKRRRFCQRHLRRGDCGREDSDANYRVLNGPGPDQADFTGANVTESASVTIQVDSPDDIVRAVDAVRDGLRSNPSEN